MKNLALILVFVFSFFTLSCCSQKKTTQNYESKDQIVDPLDPIVGDMSKVDGQKIGFKSNDFDDNGYCYIQLLLNDKLDIVKYEIKSVRLKRMDGSVSRITDMEMIKQLDIKDSEIKNFLNLISFSKRNPDEKIDGNWKKMVAIPLTKN
ncbi:hypothetical protein SAMN04487891_1208 [Flagellimonas taeanensis]|uniref:Lipoprotein n=1 Tax=Flagellimonas taeanensis TaxID=1005926 RepID=A0A1M7CYH7_9FLAO|nr:hypothetical protein [Allomuricauda taeanensis]SFC66739.1 hypothetical protein SAMN04487891_1208 [Allomuricauda taeanensis]SHL72301.1 hypothetical protein SAMN05216293_4146 [Allomuricauda taeanensis]